jgi:TatD DNase family protein
MQFVDTHCHIQSAGQEKGERSTRELWAKAGGITADELITQAAESGVFRLLCVGCDLGDSKLAVNFVKSRENCFASIGIHPHEARHYAGQRDLLSEFARLASGPKVVAIGECGLDYFYEHSPKAAQLELLHFQLSLAQERGLPVIFHVREAFDDFWPVFDQYPGLRGVLHSFTDSQNNLQKAVARNLFVGVNGIATFTKSEAQRDMYKAIPLGNLLLETDAPFLTPVPFRGKICTPKHVVATAEFLSKLRGESLEVLGDSTTQNAINLFKL